jgi:hypothetical protein
MIAQELIRRIIREVPSIRQGQLTTINNFLANGKIMKKTLLIAAIVAAGITFAMADDASPLVDCTKLATHRRNRCGLHDPLG